MSDHGERTREGMARARERGAQIGKPVAASFLPTYRRVLSMVEDGRGLTEVAAILNREQVPTARGGRWYASTVKAICESKTAKGLA